MRLHVGRPRENKIHPMVRYHLPPSPSDLSSRTLSSWESHSWLPLPLSADSQLMLDLTLRPWRAVGSAWHMLKEMALPQLCAYVLHVAREWALLWCCARVEEGELVTRGPCPLEDTSIHCCLSLSVTSSHSHMTDTVWPLQRHTKESCIKGQVNWELCILFQLFLHYNANTKCWMKNMVVPHAKLALYSSWKKTEHQL